MSEPDVYAAHITPPSRRLMSFFRLYLIWYLRRHFHALRLANASRFPSAQTLVVCVNHPSWWDPLTIMMLSHHLLPEADHYGPMEENALNHYSLFRRMGAFPVTTTSPTAGRQFIASARQVLARGGVLWVTPEGRFVDVRNQPVVLKSGLAHLISQLYRVTVVPIAFEYTFWNERLPEILVNCGEPLQITSGRSNHAHQWNELMTHAMSSVQEELAQLAITRQPSNFETILAGGTGISGIYESWKRIQALITRAEYRAEHGSINKS